MARYLTFVGRGSQRKMMASGNHLLDNREEEAQKEAQDYLDIIKKEAERGKKKP